MSEIKVDTITGKTTAGDVTITADGTVTMKLQDGIFKYWSNYDATNQVVDGSLNCSTVTDDSAGQFASNFINNFNNTIDDRCWFGSVWNTANDSATSTIISYTRGCMNIQQNWHGTSNRQAPSTSKVSYSVAYGATSASNGAAVDASANYSGMMGDLA